MATRLRHGLPLSIALFLSATVASADPSVLEQMFGPVQPLTSLTVELQASGFDLRGTEGQFSTQAVSAEYAPFPFLSFRGRVPSHFLSLVKTPLTFGMGDLDLEARVRLLGQWGRSSLLVGTQLSLPTGEVTTGFGAGRLYAQPFISGGMGWNGWTVTGTLGAELAGDKAAGTAAPVVFVRPRSDRELFGRALVSYAWAPRGVGFLAADVIYPRAGPELGRVLVRGQLGAGFSPTWGSRIGLGVGFPLAGPHREEWRVQLSAQFLLMPEG